MNPRRFLGSAIGLVTNLDDPERQGRIRVRFPWLDEKTESFWCRLSSSQGGNSRGNFIRPEMGDEVLVMFERGDINQPWVMGVLWNGKDAPPGPGNGDGKNDHKFFQSRSGHQLIFNDGSDGGYIEFHDAKQKLHTKIDVPGKHIHTKADSGFIEIKAPSGTIHFKCVDFNLTSTEKTSIDVTNGNTINVSANRKTKVGKQYDQVAGSSLSMSTPNFSLEGVTLLSKTGGTSVSMGNIDAEIQPQIAMKLKGPVTRNIAKATFKVGQMRTTNGGQPSGPFTWNGGPVMLQGDNGIIFGSSAPISVSAGSISAKAGQVVIASDGGQGAAIVPAGRIGLLGGLMLLNPQAITMPTTKMLDLMIGADKHTTGPAPIPAPPILTFPYAFANPLLLDVRLNVLVNFMPAAGSGATAIGAHIPPIPPPPWIPVPMTYRSLLTAAFMALFLAPVGMAVESFTAGVKSLIQGENKKAAELTDNNSKPHWLLRAFPMFASPSGFLAMLVGLLPFPIAAGSISVASPTVRYGDTPAGLTGLPFANTCSDIPVIPNASVVGFSNVMVGIDLASALDQLLINALKSGITHAIKEGIKDGGPKVVERIGKSQNQTLRNVTQKICKFVGHETSVAQGHPVDVVSGALFDVQTDVELPGPLPLKIERFFNSIASAQNQGGGLGVGFRTTLDQYLTRHERPDGKTRFWAWHTPDMRVVELPYLDDFGQFERVGNHEFCHSGVRLWDLKDADGVTWRFEECVDGEARLVHWFDDHDNVITVEYANQTGFEASALIDSVGRRLSLVWEEGRLEFIRLEGSDERQNRAVLRTYRYDERRLLIATAAADGHETHFVYDEQGRLFREVRPSGYGWTFHYDTQSRVTTTYGDDLRYYRRFEYAPEAKMTVVEEALGARHRYRYDQDHRVTFIQDPEDAGTAFTYDEAGRKLSETDPQGHVTEWKYDDNGRLIAAKQPDGGVHTWAYDTRGWLIEATDPCGATTHYSRDAKGNPVLIRHPDGTETRRRYDSAGRLIAELLPDNSEHRYTYDAHGDCVEEEHDGQKIRCGYDGQGRLLTWQVGDQLTRMTYDPAGRLLHRVDPDGKELKYTYDADGHRTSMTDEAGQTWTYTRDEADRLVSYRSPEGYHRQSQRGIHGQYEAHRIGGEAVYQYRHDKRGAVVVELTSDGQELHRRRNAAGFSIATQFADGRTLHRDVDHAGRPTKLTTEDGTRRLFAYDALGRVVSAVELPAGTRERPETPDGAPTDPQVGEIKVEQHRLPTGEVVDELGPNGRVRRRFERGRLKTLDVDGARLDIHRDQRGRPIALDTPEGRLEFLSDEQGRWLRTPKGGQVWYGEDAFAVFNRRNTQSLTYRAHRNELGQQVGETLKFGATGKVERRFAFNADRKLAEGYDPAGNRLLDGFVYGPAQTLLQDPAGPIELDPRGRVRSRAVAGGRQRLRWDDADRLREVETPDGTVFSYTYDALGRLVARTRDPISGPITRETFIWDEDRLAGEDRADGTRVRYLRLNAKDFVPFAAWVTPPDGEGRLVLLHADRRGAIIGATDLAGELLWVGDYEAYGAVKTTGDLDQRLRLPGMWADPATGLYYNRHRWYVPEWGRYLSPDPLNIGGGDHRYGYADGDPIHRVDPLGLSCTDGDASTPQNTPVDAPESFRDTPEAYVPGEYLAGKAPKQVSPGIRTLEGQYINDQGRVEPWVAHYDGYGRQIGRTDSNAGNKTANIPDLHHHKYAYGPGNNGTEIGSHLPGEYEP